ncbi:amidase family protein [Lophiotrema nucula]|uniref:Amidase family protein n=1 Tax=Lophiotrema nucula TaxID=690887 RepID=A0A6A5YI72_9PLEO|nr:amidase family protein [Lophiotrema nucula]
MSRGIDARSSTATHLQRHLTTGSTTSVELVDLYLEQIRKHNPYLKAILATAPKHLLHETASALDQERRQGKFRGPLHGIPLVVKDNIDVAPALGLPPHALVQAGAIVIAKANLSEWSWFRSDLAHSGWSAVGGQTQSAYVKGGFREDDSGGGHSNPGGSSSGSAQAVAAGFAPVAIGTETMGSLIMPSDRAARYTIKCTVKTIPQDGIVPIARGADCAGPMAKSVEDLANLLDVLVDPSTTNVPPGGYCSAVTGTWDTIKVGYLKPESWLFSPEIVRYEKEATDQICRDYYAAIGLLKRSLRVKPVELPSINDSTDGGRKNIWDAFTHAFPNLLQEYLTGVDDAQIRCLKDLIDFNEEHVEQELPRSANNQNVFIRALNSNMTSERHDEIIRWARNRCGKEGIDKTLDENDVDVIIGPGDGPMFVISGTAGYPVASLPLGRLDFNGRPFGLQVTTRAHQEALLIQVQSAWESMFPRRQPPPLDEVDPIPSPSCAVSGS